MSWAVTVKGFKFTAKMDRELSKVGLTTRLTKGFVKEFLKKYPKFPFSVYCRVAGADFLYIYNKLNNSGLRALFKYP